MRPNKLPQPSDAAGPGIAGFMASLKASEWLDSQIVHHEIIPGQPARQGTPPASWPPSFIAALGRAGITSLYSHQAEGCARIAAGEHIILATPTASGKSLVYNLPVLLATGNNPSTRALYLFPLKALAQDQLRTLQALAGKLGLGERVRAAVFDGDTLEKERRELKKFPPQILVTNPDMLHLSLLGYHGVWAAFWAGLKYVVIDEAHTYRGIFGSHAAWVLRRLDRICRHYGARPQYILATATIGNPGAFAERLVGQPVTVIDQSGAARGGRHFFFMNPLQGAGGVAATVLREAIVRGLRTIVYTQSRKMTELIAIWAQNRLGPLAAKLAAYRAGFLPEDRRDIERQLAAGTLLGVVSTSALELGIDIGNLDLCILVGYPGSIMNTWQRGGRVGRRQQESLILLLAQEDALDQYFMRNPQDFFSRPMEVAVLNPLNPVVMAEHLACAAAEMPLVAGEPLLAEPAVQARVAEMTAAGRLLASPDGTRWFARDKYPHGRVDLRGSGRTYAIRKAGGVLLGEIDGNRCMKECHPGAVYLHRGQTWLVEDLDIEARQVMVAAKNLPYFTKSLAEKETEILKVYERKQKGSLIATFGLVRVTERVTAYQRKLVRGQKIIATEPLDLPPNIYETEGFWIEIPAAVEKRIVDRGLHFMGGIHAYEHAAIGVFPLVALCDRNDIGGISHPSHPQLPGAAVFIYDGHSGGVGITREVFGRLDELVTLVAKTISSCPCELGCPSCIHSPKCGSGNRPIDKEAAKMVAAGLLAAAPAPVKIRRRQATAGGEPKAVPPSSSSLPASAPTTDRTKEVSRTPGKAQERPTDRIEVVSRAPGRAQERPTALEKVDVPAVTPVPVAEPEEPAVVIAVAPAPVMIAPFPGMILADSPPMAAPTPSPAPAAIAQARTSKPYEEPHRLEAAATPSPDIKIRYGVFDLETQRDASEVGGWGRADRMGVSVGVIWDSGENAFATYLEDDMAGLVQHLKELDLVVGFNILGFDYKVLAGYTKEPLHLLPTLDLLFEIKKRLGYRLSLDSLARHTLNIGKSGHGLEALQWYREGKIDKIAAYCRKDVEITRDLFLHAVREEYLSFANKAGQVVRCPLRLNLTTAMLVGGCGD